MKRLLLVAIGLINFSLIQPMDHFPTQTQGVFAITLAPQERLALIKKRLHDRTLAFMLDQHGSKNLLNAKHLDEAQKLTGFIGFYFAVHQESLNEVSNVAEFSPLCKSFLCDKDRRCEEFIKPAVTVNAMALAYVINAWSMYLQAGDDNYFITEQCAGKEYDLHLLLGFQNISVIASYVIDKIKKYKKGQASEDQNMTQEIEILEQLLIGDYSGAFQVIEKELEIIIGNYQLSWSVWAQKTVSGILSYLPSY